MTITDRDAATLTANERLAEIAHIFAVGYLRLRVARQERDKGLDVLGGREAQCASKALNPQSEDHAA